MKLLKNNKRSENQQRKSKNEIEKLKNKKTHQKIMDEQ